MSKIFKYTLELNKFEQTIYIPFNSRVMKISAAPSENRFLEFWCKVHPDNEPLALQFITVFTGQDHPDEGWEYFTTVKDGHNIVYHLFCKFL